MEGWTLNLYSRALLNVVRQTGLLLPNPMPLMRMAIGVQVILVSYSISGF